MMTRRHTIQGIAAATAVGILLTIYGLFFIQARDEAIYVCANFKPGVTEQSVLRQLATLELSSVSTQKTEDGQTIRYSSWLTAHTYQCVIHIGDDEKVKQAFLR